MIIGWWRRDEVGVLSVSAEAGAVSANKSLVLAMTQQVERRAWLPMVVILSAVFNKEEEEWLESGCWVDNWWLITSRFIRVGDATSFSSSDLLVDWCWMFCGLFG
eukprot:scaffold77056_cov71-Attheya_sp.AAC.6